MRRWKIAGVVLVRERQKQRLLVDLVKVNDASQQRKQVLFEGLTGQAYYLVDENASPSPRARTVPARAGWAEASKAIAAAGDDALVLPEFDLQDDADQTW